jgi:hypothetical protein
MTKVENLEAAIAAGVIVGLVAVVVDHNLVKESVKPILVSIATAIVLGLIANLVSKPKTKRK